MGNSSDDNLTPQTGPKGDAPNVTRIPLSSDPTQPIRLVRPKPAAPEGPADVPEEWKGDDRTLIETPAPAPVAAPEDSGWTGADRTTVTPVNEDWKGDDRTAVVPTGDWKGDDQTLVGALAPERGPAGASDWKGDDATQLGIAPGAPQGKRREGGTTTQGSKTPGSRATTIQMDDGWHFKGRQGPLTGTRIGDYEIGGILGEGGMGTVYRAKQVSLKRRAAVKVLPPNLAADLNLRARFEQEAHTASLLNTPHVVQVFGAGTDGDTVYFAMEYVEGTDLSAVIHEKKENGLNFTPEEAAGYVIQATRGLAEAGKHNIVHRDIKPANLMVTTKGVVKIADFGISKVAGEHGMTMTGTAVGTPAYCSPEQGRGDQVDPRADLYSLGVVFYELLTGRKPFDGTTANALIYQHNYQEPKLPTELRPDLPDAYQAVCLKCLMKNPDQRYGDASELLADLERVRDGNMSLTAVFQAKFGTGAEDAMAKYLGVRKRWWVKWVIAASFLAIIGGGGIAWWSTTAADRRAVAEQRLREVAIHKENLRPLDRAEAIPKSAKDDLAWLTANTEADQDLPRWQAKYTRVSTLQGRLATVLDAAQLPDATQRLAAGKDLEAFIDDVGQTSESSRWKARLAEADRREAELRAGLKSDLDSADTLSGALRAKAAPAVTELARLSGDADTDVSRWKRRLAEAEAEVAARRAELAVLDDAGKSPSEAQAAALAGSLARFIALTGPQEADAVRWGGRLAELDQTLASLRRTLGAELDRERILTVAQQEAIRPYLERYRARVDAGNPQLVAWSRRLDESAARVEALRKTLSAGLDKEGSLPSETALVELQATLKDYATLVAPDDERLAAWSARLRAERDGIDGDRQLLTAIDRLKDGEHLPTLVARLAAEKAVGRLDARGAIAADRKGFYQRRIAEEKAWEEAQRADLAGREKDAAAATTPETIKLVELLGNYAGSQDPQVAAWRSRLSRFFELRDQLVTLNDKTPLPPNVDGNLQALQTLAPAYDRLPAWRAKVARVHQLVEALRGIELVRPLPANALANAKELVEQWVGAEDPVTNGWLGKAKQVTALRVELSELFDDQAGSSKPTNQVLPAETAGAAPKAAQQLIALTGDSQPEVRHWLYRARALFGPGRPAWASAYERDGYGPYADFPIEGQRVRLRWIPPGSYARGSPLDEPGREDDEPLVPAVTITQGFWLADSETTQGVWQAVMGANPSRFSRGDAADRPVERVSCPDVDAFLKALATRLPAAAYPRLPREAEWEYACRGGLAGPYASYTGNVDEAHLDEIAWFGLRDGTRGVRRRAPNRFGLFDMQGNVWEWCADRYGTYSAADTIDPEGRQEETRVARGGSWADPARSLRAANRIALRPEMRTLYVGFRFAIPAEWPAGQEPKRPGSGDEVSSR